MPAVAPRFPAVLVLMGKSLGKEEIQVSVGEFVRSLVNGGLENVPIARNWPVAPKLPTERALGMMVSERRLSGSSPPFEAVTVRLALELTSPLNAVAPAVIVVVPAATAVTSPVALTVATVGELELQVTVLVMFCVEGRLALPNVPIAVNCVV
jgi:hypothetical protein